MKVLIQQAQITDPASPLNNSRKDILIQNGIISRIDDLIDPEDAQIINGQALEVSPGWVDPFANFADPGFEFKETLESGSNAAAAGGYTDVFLIPNTKPAVDSKSQVEYIRAKAASYPVNIHPLGSVSRNNEGKDLAEMYDMHASGAIAFSDGLNPVQSSGVLLKALQYVKAFNGVIIQIPDDRSIAANGVMNEGIISTQLGLPGKPIMAEELLVARDLKLARYAGSKIHFTGVSSPKSLEYIRRAKDGGTEVTCSVTPYHLFFTEEDLVTYDTNLKVYPPLRSVKARDELRKAVLDGTIDCIASHHMPHETDSKVLEFEYAKNGMTSLESCFRAVITAISDLSSARIAELFSLNARSIFGLPVPSIREGQPAIITLFSPRGNETFSAKENFSKSKNTPFDGRTLAGKIYGIINGQRSFFTT